VDGLSLRGRSHRELGSEASFNALPFDFEDQLVSRGDVGNRIRKVFKFRRLNSKLLPSHVHAPSVSQFSVRERHRDPGVPGLETLHLYHF
jgi:hypothetical protein